MNPNPLAGLRFCFALLCFGSGCAGDATTSSYEKSIATKPKTQQTPEADKQCERAREAWDVAQTAEAIGIAHPEIQASTFRDYWREFSAGPCTARSIEDRSCLFCAYQLVESFSGIAPSESQERLRDALGLLNQHFAKNSEFQRWAYGPPIEVQRTKHENEARQRGTTAATKAPQESKIALAHALAFERGKTQLDDLADHPQGIFVALHLRGGHLVLTQCVAPDQMTHTPTQNGDRCDILSALLAKLATREYIDADGVYWVHLRQDGVQSSTQSE